MPVQEKQEMYVPSLGWEDSLEEEMATHSCILASNTTELATATTTCVCVCVCVFSRFFTIIGYYKVLSMVAYAIQ